MPREHRYRTAIVWTGNLGEGTSGYRAYSRNHEIHAAGKTGILPGSADPAFRGDPARYNPEELFVSSLGACHMLWMLHLCADAGIAVLEYQDQPEGLLAEDDDGSGEILEVILRPRMRIADASRGADAKALHARAHSLCFLARSVRFSVLIQPVVEA